MQSGGVVWFTTTEIELVACAPFVVSCKSAKAWLGLIRV
jgi:hypothetical protein